MSISKYIYLFAVIATLGIVASCSKNDSKPDTNANKAELARIIDSLTHVYNNTAEGSHPGQYAIGARTALDSIINLAVQVNTGNVYTQEQVNNALHNLLAAGQLFNTKLLQEVSVANLMAFWKFNGNAADSSGHGHDGILRTDFIGANAATGVNGGTLPQLVPDRFGRPNMAYDFKNGATIEIPYDGTLNPQSLTISCWVKIPGTNPNNYIFSLNTYNGFKFQLQSNNFLFFTFHDSNNGYHDVDDNPGAVTPNVWTHCVVSYTNGTMKFYVSGQLVKTAGVNGTPITVNPPVNLAIGNDLPQHNVTNPGTYNYYYGPNYFIGSIDDVRFYNTALSDAEVLSIFTQENSL
ncbi:MAG: LamG domain-containing protein [Ferruginibacter sp.]